MMGVDGCPGGWCVVYGGLDHPKVEIVQSITGLTDIRDHSFPVFIDIPIGLPEPGCPRLVEGEARRVLGTRSSTVFSVPTRRAVYASSYEVANKLNREDCNKGISIQSWNITPKIREVDLWLRESELQHQVIEAHPEICFRYLSKNEETIPPKKSYEGRMRRKLILSNWVAQVDDILTKVMNRYSRKQIRPDDILDALALWISATLSQKYPILKISAFAEDGMGLPMNMSFINPYEQTIPNR